jgi:hypothetical protein
MDLVPRFSERGEAHYEATFERYWPEPTPTAVR